MPSFAKPWTGRLAASLALLGALGCARAQDVELFERPDFTGMRLTLDAAAADLAAFGMAGRVSSVVVARGQWEFCTQPQYRGACITVGPGRYGRLPPALNDNLASLRPSASVPVPPPPTPVRPPIGSAASIVLFAGDFGGSQLALAEGVPDLRERGFNDATQTIDVLAGQWELCSDGGFAGQCLTIGPGRHALPPALRGRLSSVRPLAAGVVAPAPVQPPGPGRFGPAVVLFEHRDGGGRQLPLSAATPALGPLGFNDRASSVEVFRGRWQLCRHVDFAGECIVLGPGRHNLDGLMQDAVSSLRPVFGPGDQPLGAVGAVTLFEQPDPRGRTLVRGEATGNLRDHGFNDRAVAIEVHGGRWELCEASDYRGRCAIFGPGFHMLPEGLAGQVSSLRPR